MSQAQPRFQELLSRLRSYITATFRPGERLPSKRALAAMHDVSPTTIERACYVLRREGTVAAKARLGYSRAGSPAIRVARRKKKLAFALMSRRSTDEWESCEIYPALLEEAKKRQIEMRPLANPHYLRMTLERNRLDLTRVPWNSFDVALLVEAEEMVRTRDPALYSHRVLAVDQDATEYGLDSVAFANAQAGALAARHLHSFGHLRFAVTDEVNAAGYPADPSCLSRRHGFETVLAEIGGMLLPQWRIPITRRSYPAWIAPPGCGLSTDVVKATVATWMSAPPGQRPTALFAITPVPLLQGGLIEELSRNGIRVPRDFSIVSITWNGSFFGGGAPVVDGLPITCVDFDLSALVKRTFDAAIELAHEKARPPSRSPRLTLAPVRLIPGQSIAAAPK
jgi:DNA-binding LacI/PurR family transcriptional regulator/DNA-binding transcriptional regulator YhcF (GntR family)